MLNAIRRLRARKTKLSIKKRHLIAGDWSPFIADTPPFEVLINLSENFTAHDYAINLLFLFLYARGRGRYRPGPLPRRRGALAARAASNGRSDPATAAAAASGRIVPLSRKRSLRHDDKRLTTVSATRYIETVVSIVVVMCVCVVQCSW